MKKLLFRILITISIGTLAITLVIKVNNSKSVNSCEASGKNSACIQGGNVININR